MSQPEFKELAYQEITPGIKNELLKLAINTNNLKAEFILIMIDQIKQHAIEHNFYDNPQAIQRHMNRKMIIQSGYIAILFLRSNLPIASIFLQHGLSYLLPHKAQSISFKQRMFSKAIEFNQKSINNNVAVVIESSPFGTT